MNYELLYDVKLSCSLSPSLREHTTVSMNAVPPWKKCPAQPESPKINYAPVGKICFRNQMSQCIIQL